MDDSKLLAVGLITITTLGILWFVFGSTELFSKSASDKIKAISTSNSGHLPDPTLCSEVFGSCVASAQDSAVACSDKEIRDKLREQLADPMETELCRQARHEMSQTCPKACRFDEASLLVIPGAIEVTSGEIAPGSCEIVSSRPVSFRGSCRRAAQ